MNGSANRSSADARQRGGWPVIVLTSAWLGAALTWGSIRWTEPAPVAASPAASPRETNDVAELLATNAQLKAESQKAKRDFDDLRQEAETLRTAQRARDVEVASLKTELEQLRGRSPNGTKGMRPIEPSTRLASDSEVPTRASFRPSPKPLPADSASTSDGSNSAPSVGVNSPNARLKLPQVSRKGASPSAPNP